MTRTRSLLLRPVAAADVDAVWRLHSDPETNRYNPAGPMADRDRARARAEEWAADWMSGGFGYWAVEEGSAPGVVVGFGGIRVVGWRGRNVWNLYYRLAPEAWGHGYASEIVQASIAEWRERGNGLPLIAYTTADNIPSQRTAAKGGLQRRPDLDEAHDTYTDVVFALGLD